jgi:uncharacterized membrane protein YukC
MEKHAHESNEQIEDRMRSINKQLKEYEMELDEERKSKQQILQQRKKLEIDLQDSRQQIEEANKQKEEALRNTRRLQVIYHLFIFYFNYSIFYLDTSS